MWIVENINGDDSVVKTEFKTYEEAKSVFGMDFRFRIPCAYLKFGEKMLIGLHDAEKDYFKGGKIFPNYALMKIAAWHKSQGDTVEWWNPLYRYDRVYSSKVFVSPRKIHIYRQIQFGRNRIPRSADKQRITHRD